MKAQSVIVPRWYDRHLHIRRAEMMKVVLPCTLKQRATGAVIMGNLPDPFQTSTIERALAYRNQITLAQQEFVDEQDQPDDSCVGYDFKPCMTCYLTDEITPEEVVRGFEEGVWCAVKLYMADQSGRGGTTGSQHGVKNLVGRYPVFKAMLECSQRLKKPFPLLGHFEAVEEGVDEFDREVVSMELHLEPLLKEFPELSVVVEHITDRRMADFVAETTYRNVYATVTPHHLMLNRNALFRDGMNPSHWCKPVLKREAHRLAIRNYVTSGHPRFGAGTDSAPHDESTKSRCCGNCAGIFTAPNAVELYTTVFDEDNALVNLGPFLSENFLHLYGMNVSKEMMTIERKLFRVPEKIGSVRVFKEGETLQWKLVEE